MRELSKEELKIELAKILTYNKDDVSIDAEDIDDFIKNKIFMSVSEYRGNKPVENAMRLAIKQFELEDVSIVRATGILINFESHLNCLLSDLSEALNIVYETFCDEADIIFGTSIHDNNPLDYAKVIVVVSSTT